MRAKGKKPAPVRETGEPAKTVNPPHSPNSSLEARVEALAAILRRHELNEIEVELEGARIYLRRGGGEPELALAPAAAVAHGHGSHAPVVAHAPAHGPVTPPPPPALVPAAPAPSSTDTSDGNVAYVTSPFVGTFYRSPSPDSAPFVDVGTRVRKGQVICIVEAMKLMNEIESEIDGSIVQILVENGQAVEYGEPLFKIKQG
jgi:acetyl-CoA carboxylase biotin carboxyl carrier protein